MHNTADLTDFHWLLSSEATPWLELAAGELEPSVGTVARWRKELSAERVHLVLQQAALRQRAREKFADAARMFFTPLGLEQATDEAIAGYKAERFAALKKGTGTSRRGELAGEPDRSLGASPLFQQSAFGAPVADLCCGIGGDLLALARRGSVVGVDRDPLAALFARANLAACRLSFNANSGSAASRSATVQTIDIATFATADCEAWHIDPDRRPDGRRTTRASLHDPPPEAIERLLADCPHGAVKLAPGAVLPDGWEARAELEWISSRRECRQLVVWFGGLAGRQGTRRATILSTVRERRTFLGQADLYTPVADRVGRYIFEPDAAVLAAGLCGALAAECGLEAVTAQAAYLTGEPAVHVLHDPALACFEVMDVLPFRIKPLRQWLRDRGMGRVEVKKRGVDIDPQRIVAELQGSGDGRATLLIYKAREKITAIVGRRLQPLSKSGLAGRI